MKCDFKDFSGNQNISREKNKKKQKKILVVEYLGRAGKVFKFF